MLGNNWDDPRTMATLQMAAGLMAAGGPSKDPVNLGQGLLGGLDRYNSVLDNAKKMKMAEEELGIKKGTLDYHNREVALKEAIAKRDAEYVANLGKLLTGAGAPISSSEALAQGAAAGSVGPTNVNAVRMNTQSQAGTPVIPDNYRTAMLLEAGGPNKGKGVPDMYIKATTPDPLVIDGFVFDKRTMQIPPDGTFVPKVTTSADGKVMVTYRGTDGQFHTTSAIGSVNAYREFENIKKQVENENTLPKMDMLGAGGRPIPGGNVRQQIQNLGGESAFPLTGGSATPARQQPSFQVPPNVQADRDAVSLDMIRQERTGLLARAARGDKAAQAAIPDIDAQIARLEGVAQKPQQGAMPSASPSAMPIQLAGPSDIKNKEYEVKQFHEKTWPAVKEAYDSALNRRENVQVARQALSEIKTEGAFANFKGQFANVLVGLGIAPDNARMYATNMQTFNSVSATRLWDVLNAAKGPQTEGDAKRAQATFAQLTNTKEANAFILDLMEAVAQRDIMRKLYFDKAYPIARDRGDVTLVEKNWNPPSIFSMPSMKRWTNA